jgi:hypothetical protein
MAVAMKVPVLRCFAKYSPQARRRSLLGMRRTRTRQTSWEIMSCCYRRTEHSHSAPSAPDRFTLLEMLDVIILCLVESSWNVMAPGDAREGKRRGICQMDWVASTLHTTSEHRVSSITTADVHTSAASSRLN